MYGCLLYIHWHRSECYIYIRIVTEHATGWTFKCRSQRRRGSCPANSRLLARKKTIISSSVSVISVCIIQRTMGTSVVRMTGISSYPVFFFMNLWGELEISRYATATMTIASMCGRRQTNGDANVNRIKLKDWLNHQTYCCFRITIWRHHLLHVI